MRRVILTNNENRVINNDAERRVVGSEEIRLFTASEAAKVLHISRNAVYTIWRNGLLDYWNINGTKVTNLTAIADFLESTKNQDLRVDKEEA